MNISPGPPWSNCAPVVAITGMITRAASNAAIVSNKADDAVKDLAKYYFAKYIDVAIGEREGISRKPAPDSVYEAMRLLGATKENTVYVGDSDVDRATAKNAGIPCISVTWGFRSEELLVSLEPEYLIHKPEEILSVVTGK